ncbi:MAG: M43 family zinc metalloprotease [Flavisolibacter sp.]
MSHRIESCLFLLLIFSLPVFAQKKDKSRQEQCGTVNRLDLKFAQNPDLKIKFERQRDLFNLRLSQVKSEKINATQRTTATNYIPVVFHIVLSNPNIVTDAQIQAQLDTLNRDFFGSNGDSVNIPSWFKPLYGKSSIQFCLAQRTPDGDATNGIERSSTNASSFGIDDAVKHTNQGGVDIWNGDKYFNVWVCNLSNGVLGYASFPDDGSPNEQGVVIDYRSLPGGSAYPAFNQGKTLTHETGHYFNLYHIWGDDGGACTGTDFISDTPNQADYTSGTFNGVKTDACTTGGNGVMYQNYMDYTDDIDLVLFTTEQVNRMESAMTTYRSSLLISDGCQPAVLKNFNSQLRSIDQPAQRLCSGSFSPVITIRNKGIQTLTSLQVTTRIDNGASTSYTWNGSLGQQSSASITLPNLTAPVGLHQVTIYTSNPNSNADEDPSNDTLSLSFQFYAPVATVSESFESSTFPPSGWDIVNPDQSITWQRVTGVGKSGNASVMINNYDYQDVGQKDDLRMPTINVPTSVDSIFLSFQVAAATYTALSTSGNIWDTLEVLASRDCGLTYTSLYKKWAGTLVTSKTTVGTAFVPASSEWRKDSINLGNFIGANNLLLTFRNTTGYENNVYLDDINVRVVSINPNLKREGFLITPNPTSGNIAVQFYPQPTRLVGIQVMSATGQKLSELVVHNNAANYYNFDLSLYPAGTYMVRAVFDDKVIVKKIVKL